MPSDDIRSIGRDAVAKGTRGLEAASQHVRSLFERQGERVGHQLDGVAEALREAATHLAAHDNGAVNGAVADIASGAAERVGEAADFLKRASLDQVTERVETFARRSPRVFIGGALATGFLLTRLTKASSGRRRAERALGGESHP